MSEFYLERKDPSNNETQKISLGVLSVNTFYPTMPYNVFEILVREAQFKIVTETKKELSLNEFRMAINNLYGTLSPPMIVLDA